MATETEKGSKAISERKPFSGLTQMEREMERWFDDMMGRPRFRLGLPDWWRRRELMPRQPAVEIAEDKEQVIVTAEIPGLKKGDIQVNLSDTLLTISGERKEETEKREKGYYYSERSYGSFTRSIQLPAEVKTDKASATFKDGVLEIRLPKTEQAKQREVTIKVD
ncbi:MAG TPA: Hsp20/alpha crystallin family protein [Nitrospiria bacterium]|nr:Hsp20/alpha crystallin family protein [Nitrospiria bacterium]